MQDFVKLTGTQIAAMREITGDLQVEQVNRKLERMRLGLGRAIWSNPRISPSDNTTRRILGGINWFIEQYGYAPSPAAFNRNNFDSFLLQLEQVYGANVTQAWMNPNEMAGFEGLDSSVLDKNYDDQTIGRYVTRYRSQYGHEVSLVTDPQSPTGSIYVFQNSQLSVKPLRGRQLQSGELAKTGDSVKTMLVGEYTLEFNQSNTAGKFDIT